MLVPALKLGQGVVMDNASFHKSERLREFIEQAGSERLFLPGLEQDREVLGKTEAASWSDPNAI